MEFFDFINQDEMSELPEDSRAAFVAFVRIAGPRLRDRLRDLGSRDESNYQDIDDARYGFQNVILGAARKYGIEPFASMQMPTMRDHDDQNFRQFRHDLTHYITQIMLATADVDRSGSVPLLESTRQTLKTYIFHLRDAIARTNLPDWKKDDLTKKLDELEKELDRRRVRFAVVVGVIMTVLAAPGELVGSYDAVVRITNCIMRELGQAKTADDQQRKVSFDEPIGLLAPRQQKTKQDEMDDEIPF